MILASGFENSAIAAQLLGLTATAFVSILVMVVRMLITLNTVRNSLTNLEKDIGELNADTDIVRWSELARMGVRRGGTEFLKDVGSS